MNGRGLIIGAARSGAGKTSVTIGLLRAFKRRGLAINGAKSGPDYIDPGFHCAASGQRGVNLDSWAMAPDLLAGLLAHAVSGQDLLLIESAMGLFDGIDGGSGRSGAAADLARRFGLPAIIVLDISGQSKTAAAIAHGFASFDPGVAIAGVILNQVASDRHHAQAADAITAHGIQVLGSIRRNPEMALPERHLGRSSGRTYSFGKLHRKACGYYRTVRRPGRRGRCRTAHLTRRRHACTATARATHCFGPRSRVYLSLPASIVSMAGRRGGNISVLAAGE